MIELLKKLYPLHRTLVSDDTDKAYSYVQNEIPNEFNTNILEFKTKTKVWYWTIPQRYKVIKAILKDEDGVIYADFDKNPLYLWSYSISVNKVIDFKELDQHLYYSKIRPDAIAWRFKYYDKDWGFCIPYNIYKNMPRNKKYIVEIESRFLDKPGFKILNSYINYNCDNDFIFVTNICHPYQVNDSISGLVVAVELQKRLAKNPIKDATHNINFLYCPETIGSIVYLANNEEKIENTTGGIFTEMVGDNYDSFILQLSIDKEHKINKILEYVLKKQNKEYYIREFERWNDEGILNSFGVDIQAPYLMRGKYQDDKTIYYKEYHTSDDNPNIIDENKLIEAADILEDFLRIYCSDYIPIQKEKGIIFFSGIGMHTAIEENREVALQLEKLSYMLNGQYSIFEISQVLKVDYYQIKDFIDKLFDKEVIDKI